jgi:3D (Asp-Asp-Asp) domain-containing protein
MKALVSRSVIVATALLIGFVIFTAKSSVAETPSFRLQSQKADSKENVSSVLGKFGAEDDATSQRSPVTASQALAPPASFVATAYSLRGRTASGRMVSRGLIAADPSVLPLGSRVLLEHPGYSGEYVVADTGGSIRGRRIDIWTPSAGEAMRFGRRTVKLTVLSYGARRPRRTSKG